MLQGKMIESAGGQMLSPSSEKPEDFTHEKIRKPPSLIDSRWLRNDLP
jgi:hypothetical protein